MIRISDLPKTYWSYYQNYLVQVFRMKIRKNIESIFSKNPKGIVWWKKISETEVGAIFKFGPKIELMRPVGYVDANMASSYGLTCL